jgi:hypothetical protein
VAQKPQPQDVQRCFHPGENNENGEEIKSVSRISRVSQIDQRLFSSLASAVSLFVLAPNLSICKLLPMLCKVLLRLVAQIMPRKKGAVAFSLLRKQQTTAC